MMTRHHHCHHRQQRQQSCLRPSTTVATAAILAITLLATTTSHQQLSAAEALTPPPLFVTITNNNNNDYGHHKGEVMRIYSSVGLTIDDAEPASGLWKLRPNNNSDNNSNSRRGRNDNKGRQQQKGNTIGNSLSVEQLVPFGPVPRGGSLSDIVILPSRGGVASAATSTQLDQPRNPIVTTWSNVRSGVRGARRRIVYAANMTLLRGVSARDHSHQQQHQQLQQQGLAHSNNNNDTLKNSRRIVLNTPDTIKNINVGSMLRVGGKINRRLLRHRRAARTAKTGAITDTAVLATQLESSVIMEDVVEDVVDGWSDVEMIMKDVSLTNNALLEAALESSSASSDRIEVEDNKRAAVAIDAVGNKSDSLSLPIVGRLFQRRHHHHQQQQQELQQNQSQERVVVEHHKLIGAAYDMASMVTTSKTSAKSDDIAVGGTKQALVSRGGDAATVATVASSSSVSSSASTIGSEMNMMDTYIIETPLFPIILPKAFEPPSAAAGASDDSTSVAARSVTSLEISVAIQEDVTTTTADTAVTETINKPSQQLLQAATSPLLPKATMDSFTGTELYFPESMEMLAKTGLAMTLGQGWNEYVNWVGDKKTEKFLKDHSNAASVGGGEGKGAGSKEWYQALDSSQEVLVWAGKFTTGGNGEYYGAELPIIKTTSIIHRSPKYLAELLMDSERVKVYNKMSLGRTDVEVFQRGVDTQGGAFGDGESKVVRNLTKPPMVSSLIEFVTCMHARKLRPSDMKILSPENNNDNDNDGESIPADGYIVVSRAVTGGKWNVNNDNDNTNSKHSTGEKLVRNEILLGVNILKSVPGEPNKTELTAVTHVYSPMIPLMLAKNAGVKGAVDFVRDIRALP